MEFVKAHIGKEKYKTTITTSTKEFISDMPEGEGGASLGVKPKELLASALASCIAMTVRMYADRSKWPLEEVFVEVELDTETTPGTSIFRKKVDFKGDLTEEQLKRLHVIAMKCPIYKLLQNPTVME
ncbi:OsmC family protein [Flavobacterium sp. xlx-214]|uniref:OsmC family protein n=1 Tax=unclassified Flavobacterium TaxID=196869 RepID=UPI0013D3747D|nr:MULTISPECIES: OsmC family protein [unclassified Flavobacterium]MBA5792967.1 OsmC family protein [Flavobacterium sp. xlx-221]QMI84700.1 OsmC family protein [Flavobacterium sp. xlx-214]